MFPTRHLGAFGLSLFLACLTVHVLMIQHTACGQDARATQATTLVVDGRVERVFQAGDQFLVQLLVQRSEAARIDLAAAARYPAPGEYVYIHASQNRSALDRVVGRGNTPGIPQPQMRLRAFLTAGRAGQWEADGQDWYQENPDDREATTADRSRDDRARSSSLGIVSQRVTEGGSALLRVVRVTPGSPAANAGVEPGDLLVEANRERLQSQQQLDDAYLNSREKFSLTVRDVRSGRDVLVNVAADASSTPQGTKSLGVTTELAFFGGQPAVKVTAVDAGSPAQRAGISVGLLILKANGTPVTSPQLLTDAEQKSRGQLQLQVVDPKDRRERAVQVSL